ncbi:putative pectinesterase/pectinesterase inhibitor 26 [Ananas comosus]|uniref:Pectinesterase/pectinesterase inhibitor 26 n=1 Tax=Ananas comosus TaxID=4615 RepID=A0A6P5G8B8_ANACO|nr:putative pectinesterase/pectinesterase inhibitor 26 [Ananas comosus]
MRPEIALFVFLPVSCFFSGLAASHCVPRTSPYAVPVNYSSLSSSYLTGSSVPPESSPPYSAPESSPLPSPPCESPPPASPPSPPTTLPPQSAAPNSGSSIDLADGVAIAICGHTDYPDLCVSSIRSLLPSSGSLDPAALLKLEMEAIRTHLKPARSAASEFFAGTKEGEPLHSIMEACINQYDDVPDTLDNALKALKAGDKGTLNSMLSALVTDFDTCEQGFEEFEMESTLAIYDKTLSQLSSNCLAIAELV